MMMMLMMISVSHAALQCVPALWDSYQADLGVFFFGRLLSDGTHIEEVETTKQRDEDEKETTNQRDVSIFAVGKHSCSVTFVLC